MGRLGIFYDGHFFSKVGDYYARGHARRSRIALAGLHAFVRERVAAARGIEPLQCELVERHYFRGRYSDESMRARGALEKFERFDAVLRAEGIVAHYRAMGDRAEEKGVDVAFALEALERTIREPLDVCVLVACDSDYLPLVEKLRAAGAFVVVVGWTFSFVEPDGRPVVTRTAPTLYEAADLALRMDAILDDEAGDPRVEAVFLRANRRAPSTRSGPAPGAPARRRGVVRQTYAHEGGKRFGYLAQADGEPDLWFGAASLERVAFDDVRPGQRVTYELGHNGKGPTAVKVRPA